jgi:hypothetical protein
MSEAETLQADEFTLKFGFDKALGHITALRIFTKTTRTVEQPLHSPGHPKTVGHYPPRGLAVKISKDY